MSAALLAALSAACFAGLVVLLRSLGSRFQVGRLLAVTPTTTIDEAVALAHAGASAYVRVSGRVISDEEFPDDHERPLVFRRTRLQLGGPSGSWKSHLDEREAVPFGVESRSVSIAVDEAALGDGLVAIPREAAGVAADLPPDLAAALPPGHDASAPVRLVIEQLSAVEQAVVCGRPVLRDGRPTMSAGTGRPLIVTTLDAPSAMRLLARDHRIRVVVVFALLLLGLALAAAAAIALLVGA